MFNSLFTNVHQTVCGQKLVRSINQVVWSMAALLDIQGNTGMLVYRSFAGDIKGIKEPVVWSITALLEILRGIKELVVWSMVGSFDGDIQGNKGTSSLVYGSFAGDIQGN